MAEEMTNIEGYEPVESNMKVLIGLRKKSDGTKLAVTGEQYNGYDKRSWIADGIIIRNEDIGADLLFSLSETEAFFAPTGEGDIPETDKRRKQANPNPQFTELDGEERTAWQVQYHHETHEGGCAICEAVKFGWLPSGGELILAADNKEAFNELATLCGADVLNDSKYWLSSQYSEDYMWCLDMETKAFEFWWSKTTQMQVRPVKSASDYIEVEDEAEE